MAEEAGQKAMKLLNEGFMDHVSVDNSDNKSLFIEGVFLGAEKRNRNGRIYHRDLIEREVNNFNKLIESREALGELDHPDNTGINTKQVAIKILKLKMDENFAIGKAKVLEYMPNGHMLAGLLRDDIAMGVSSRGVGDVNEDNIVESTYHLITIDAVYMPSCQDAYVHTVNESYEWVLDEAKNLYIEKRIEHTPEQAEEILTNAKEKFDKKLDAEGSKAIAEAFKEFFADYRHI